MRTWKRLKKPLLISLAIIFVLSVSGISGWFSGGYVATNVLGSGVADATTFLRGDQSWQTPAGGGDMVWADDVLDQDDMTSDSDTDVPTQQSVKAYVDAVAGGGGILASGYVVSNDAAVAVKTFASILNGLGFNVEVCDGTNDQVEIATVIAAAGNGRVELTNGNFNVSTLTIDVPIVGRGIGTDGRDVTVINTTGGITVHAPGYMDKIKVTTPTSFSGIAVKYEAQAASPFWISAGLWGELAIEGYPGEHTGTALQMIATSTGTDAAISESHAGQLHMSNYEYGLDIYSNEVGAGDAFINSTKFDYVHARFVNYAVYIHAASGGESSGNVIDTLTVQPDSSTVTGLTIGPGCTNNRINNYFPWDWSLASGPPSDIQTYNYVDGHKVWGAFSDRNYISLKDEFMFGNTANGTVGSLGWTYNGVTPVVIVGSTYGHPGMVSLETTASANNINYLVPQGASVNQIKPDEGWASIDCVISAGGSIASKSIFFGFMDDFSAAVGNQDRAGIEFNTALGDTNWMMVTGNGSSSTRTSTGVAAATGYWGFSVVQSGSYYYYFVKGVYIGRINTTMPDTEMNWGFQVQTLTTTSKYILIDFAELKGIGGLNRGF
jgi:hypothetical protein